MTVIVALKQGAEVPVEWRSLDVEAIWIVSLDGHMFGVFFSAVEAHAYAEWLEWRLAQHNEPDPMISCSMRCEQKLQR